MTTINEVIDKFKESYPLTDSEIIKKAYKFAKEKHGDHRRNNGEPITEHLLQTAYKLAELKLDKTAISAGILHDIMDYTDTELSEIQKEFGEEIAFLVDGITRVEKIRYRSKIKKNPKRKTDKQVENLRRIFLAMANDIRVILIKLTDQLHNLKTLYALPREKQKRHSLATLEIYAPLAHRLGIGELKGQLEDLAFSYAYPDAYQKLLSQVKDRYTESKEYLEKVIPVVKKNLTDEDIKVIEIHHRAKHYWSLYKKLQRYDMDWSKIYDLVAVRIVVPNIESCYAALGVIHKKWKPLIGRIKDYIAIPKVNGYRSLHTTVFCEEGKIIEFQIRTPKMHHEAEFGVAAHWLYKKNNTKNKNKSNYFTNPEVPTEKIKKELSWIQKLQKWQKENFSSNEEFLESLKINFLKDRIFVFTPKGDIIDLPEGATPIDFAYQIHTDIGNRCAGAKIDGKLQPFSTELKNGQVIEIMTDKNSRPKTDWLEITKTDSAKQNIRSYLRKK